LSGARGGSGWQASALAAAFDQGFGVFGDGVLDFFFDGLDVHAGGEFFVLAPAFDFLAQQHAGHFVGVGFDVGDGELADVALGEEVAGLGDGGDQAGGKLAEAVDVGGDLGPGGFGVAAGELGAGALYGGGALHVAFGGDLLPGGPDELVEAAGEADEFAGEFEEFGGVEFVFVGELEFGFEDFGGLGGPVGAGAGFGEAGVFEAGDGGFALFFGEGGGDLLEARDEEHVVLKFFGVRRGGGVVGLGRAADVDVAIPGGEADFEFLDERGALVGEELGEGVFDFIGKIIFA